MSEIKKALTKGSARLITEGLGMVRSNFRVLDVGLNTGVVPQAIQYGKDLIDSAVETAQGAYYNSGNLGPDLLKGLLVAVPIVAGARLLGKAKKEYKAIRA